MEPVAEGVLAKVDDDKRLVFGWANIIKDEEGQLLVDRQDDFIDSEDELEKAAYQYVLNSRDGGEMHVRKGVSTMVESVVLTKEKQAALGIPEGTVPTGWWIGFRVNDDRVWDQVKKGDYVGFSVHGTGQRQKKVLETGEYTEVGKADRVEFSPEIEEKLREHSPHHTGKHMRRMRELIAEGKSFDAAHEQAMEEIGKDDDCGCGCGDCAGSAVTVSKSLLNLMAKAQTHKSDKIARVMREFEEGKLKSSNGKEVTSRRQAMAIALSEQERVGKAVADRDPRYKTYTWQSIRKEILKRDKGKCQIEGSGCVGKATVVGHRKSPKNGGAFYKASNLQAECTHCSSVRGGEKTHVNSDKSVGKGGPGSGERPGHPFRGNQYTGGVRGRGGSGGGSKGKRVKKPSALSELRSKSKVTLAEGEVDDFLDRLNAEIKAAERSGRPTPNINLCRISVPGTNLFCGDNKGVPRKEMPQLGGKPRPGSDASKLPKSGKGEVDGAKKFVEHLEEKGVKVSSDTVKASSLKASQNELVGAKVVGMKNNRDFDPGSGEIFVSKDGYVIDGHHRWAAQVARDYEDGRGGDLNMKVRVVDMEIMDVLKEANSWADEFGIMPKEAKAGS